MSQEEASVPPTLESVVCTHVMSVLREAKSKGMSQRQAAKWLGVSRWTLKRMLDKYKLTADGYPRVEEKAE